MWANWVAAFGVLIELVGFGTLAYDLWQTSKSEIRDNVALDAEPDAFKTIIIGDSRGETTIEGGLLGKQIAMIRAREDGLRKRMGVIIRGVVITAIGCGFQVVGSFAQALQTPPN
jgi:hypothetical protein